jgi:hypothetical protein
MLTHTDLIVYRVRIPPIFLAGHREETSNPGPVVSRPGGSQCKHMDTCIDQDTSQSPLASYCERVFAYNQTTGNRREPAGQYSRDIAIMFIAKA